MVNVGFDSERVQRRIGVADEQEFRTLIVEIADQADRQRAKLHKLDPFTDPHPQRTAELARQAALGNARGADVLRSIAKNAWQGLNSINTHIALHA